MNQHIVRGGIAAAGSIASAVAAGWAGARPTPRDVDAMRTESLSERNCGAEAAISARIRRIVPAGTYVPH